MTTLSVAQAIRDAIRAEAASGRYYEELAQRVTHASVRRFLVDMAETERQHAHQIETNGRALLYGVLPQHASDLIELGAPVPDWIAPDDVSVEQALELAYDYEQRTSLYYAQLAAQFEPPASAFFSLLARSENLHATLVHEALHALRGAAPSLTLAKAVEMMVHAARAAERYYRKLTGQTPDPAARGALLRMTEIGNRHAGEFERVAERVQKQASEVLQEPVELVDQPPRWDLVQDLEIERALEHAVESERAAASLCESVAERLGGFDGELVRHLAANKLEHVRMLQEVLVVRGDTK